MSKKKSWITSRKGIIGNKYGNIKCEFEGIKFDSKKEMRRYLTLKQNQMLGFIQNLELQPKFKFEVDGKPLKMNRKGARQVTYTADFRYTENGETIVEDVKGFLTPEFKIKMALMWTLYGIDLRIT